MVLDLYVNFYIDQNPQRQNEIDQCFEYNLKNSEIDHIYVLLSEVHHNYFNELIENTKIDKDRFTLITIQERPTYNDYFKCSRNYTNINDLSVICNTDIILPIDTIKKIKSYSWGDDICMALTRYDINDITTFNYTFLNRVDSQDVWVVKGGFKHHELCDFTLGLPGCDNKVAFCLNENYNVINPSLDIVTLHLHLTKTRNYTSDLRVSKPYLLLPPINL